MRPLRVAVGSHARVPLEDLEPIELAELKRLFTHENQKIHVLRRLGKSLRGVEREFRTWVESPSGWLVLPRGGYVKLEAFAKRAGREILTRDERTDGSLPLEAWPKLRVKSRDYQDEFAQKMIDFDGGILRAPTGCITGDAIIVVNRAGKGAKMRLAHVVRMQRGGKSVGGKVWDLRIPTFVRAPMPDGSIRLARLLSASVSGSRPVYRVALEGGYALEATICHRFLTPTGWRRLEDLNVGDYVMVDPACGGRPIPRQKSSKGKPWYKLRAARNHPFAGRRGVNPAKGGWTVPEHRLVAEARENGMSLCDFLVAVERRHVGLRFLDPDVYAVHHRDENPRNNAPDNLEVMTHSEHKILHREQAVRNITTRLEPRRISSVEYRGERETFDLEIEHAEAFMANNVAVHNSGKTVASIVAAHRIGLPTIFVANTLKLFEQWQRQLQALLGLSEKEVGIVQGKKCRLRTVTVAMLKTLSMLPRDHEVFGAFGLLVLDEAQTSPAPTGRLAVNPFRARKRFAVSADECVARGTLIRMADGSQLPIEDIRAGYFVDTPIGPKRVLRAMFKGLCETGSVTWKGGRVRGTSETWFATNSGWSTLKATTNVCLIDENVRGMRFGSSEVLQKDDVLEVSSFIRTKRLQGVRLTHDADVSEVDAHTLRTDVEFRRERSLSEVWRICEAEEPRASHYQRSRERPVVEGAYKSGASFPCFNVEKSFASEAWKTGAVVCEDFADDVATTRGTREDQFDDKTSDCSGRETSVRRETMGQRQASTPGRDTSAESSSRLGVSNQCGDSDGVRTAESLQIGLSEQTREGGRGDRRVQPQYVEEEDFGYAQGFEVGCFGVGGSSVFVDVRSWRASRIGHVEVEAIAQFDGLILPVFDLEIEGAACYYANGALVHNTRKDGMEPMIYEMFGDIIFEVSPSKLEADGSVIPVDIFVVPSNFRADWYKGMGSREDDEDEDEESGDRARLISEMERDPERNDLCARLIAEAKGSTFAMVSHREHGRVLEVMTNSLGCRTGLMFGGEDYSDVYDETLALIESGELKAGIGTYQSIGTGIDVPRVHDVVMCTPAGTNKQRVNQAKGRACRPWGGEKRGRVFYVWDREVVGFFSHLANLARWFGPRVYVLENGRTTEASRWLRENRKRSGAYGALFR